MRLTDRASGLRLALADDPRRDDWNPPSIDPPAAPEAPAPSVPRWRHAISELRRALSKADARDCMILVGLLLLGRGSYLLLPALGWIVPGCVLLWYSLPQRPRFVQPLPPKVVQVSPPGRADGAY